MNPAPSIGFNCFAIQRGEIRERSDVWFNLPIHRLIEERIRTSKHSVFTLGDEALIAKIVDGPFGTQVKVQDYRDSGIPFIRVTDCRSGKLKDDELVFIDEQLHSKLLRSEVYPGDVLFTKTGNILGYTAVFPERFERGNISSHLVMMRPTKRILPEFLAAFFKTSLGQDQVYRWGQKATKPELNTIEIRRFLIPVPEIDVQVKMLNDLKKAEKTKEEKVKESESLINEIDSFILKELQLGELKEISNSTYSVKLGDIKSRNNENIIRIDTHYHNPNFWHRIRELKNNSNAPLGKIVSFSELQWNPKTHTNQYFSYIEISNIDTTVGNVSAERVLTSEAPSRAKMLTHSGNILISLTRPHRGAIGKVPETLDGAIASTGFAVISKITDKKVRPEFLLTILRTRICLDQMLQRSSGGNYPAITEDELKEIIIPIPSDEIQQKIIKTVEKKIGDVIRIRFEAIKQWNEALNQFEKDLIREKVTK